MRFSVRSITRGSGLLFGGVTASGFRTFGFRVRGGGWQLSFLCFGLRAWPQVLSFRGFRRLRGVPQAPWIRLSGSAS